jgi:hypothetical protein
MHPFPFRPVIYSLALKENDWCVGRENPGWEMWKHSSLRPLSLACQAPRRIPGIARVSQGFEECVEKEMKHNRREKQKIIIEMKSDIASF